MAKKNQKHENQPDQQPTPQPTAPATPLELSDEELGQVTGGFDPQPDPPGVPLAITNITSIRGLPSFYLN